MGETITGREPQPLSSTGIEPEDVVWAPELPPAPIGVADAEIGAERDDCYLEHALTEAVRHEVQRYLSVSDADLAWIVEATVFQLARLVRQSGSVDLDYLGVICEAGETSFVWLRHPRDAMAKLIEGASS